MSEKKGLFGGLFSKKKSGCCDFQIVEDTGEVDESSCGCEDSCCPAKDDTKTETDTQPTAK